MTRKDYELIAEALRVARPGAGENGRSAMRAWLSCVRVMTARLEKQNPRFDSGRFIAACTEES